MANRRWLWWVRACWVGGVLPLAVVLGLTAPVGAASTRATDYRGVIAALNAKIPGLMRTGGTVGLTIALVDGDRTVWLRGFGWADRGRRVPVTKNTLFHIGSVAKTISAAAVMQLVQRGLVDLDAPLSRYVPRFSLKRRFRNSVITVRSVLDHHSGIPGTLANGLFTESKPDLGYRGWLLRTLRQQYPERPVNTAWAYNNSGYVLLQNLVENVTGQSFVAYTRQHLFGPIGMRSTTFDDASVAASRLTHNYEAVPVNGEMHVRALPREYVNGWASGSVVSSASDMAGYLRTMIARGAVPHGRILRAGTVGEMITPQTDLPLDIAPFRMGLGWWVGDAALSWMGTVIHHAGHTLANHSEMMWLPGSKLGVFVSVNTSSPVDVERQVAALALGLIVTGKTGRTPPPPPGASPVVQVSQRTLRRAAGRYASAYGIDLVKAADGALLFTPASQNPNAASFTMTPRADGWYTADTPGVPSIKPVTAAGRELLLSRTTAGVVSAIAAGVVGAFTERIPRTYRVPAVWRNRTGNYQAVDVRPNTYPGAVAPTGSLTLHDGILLWQATPSAARGTAVLVPAGPRLAFTFGFTPFAVETNAGDGVVAGDNTLTLLGVTYRRTSAGARPAAAAAAVPAVAKTGIAWTSCGHRLECAKVSVPLDWSRPNGKHIELAVIQHLASRPDRRIGSMFINPGGPGESGVELVRDNGSLLDAWGGGRLDVVGWDPRGTNASDPVRCFTSEASQARFWRGVQIPTTPAGSRAYERKTIALARRCGRVSGELLAHISTADNARDLDYLRRLVGDRRLTYVGLSYGSFLGQTYANMFPGRVRAMMLDAIVDPRAFVKSAEARVANFVASTDEVFSQFLALCQGAGPARCALAGHPDTAAERVARLLQRARRAPIPAPHAHPPGVLSYGDLLQTTFTPLRDPQLWSQYAQELDAAANGDASALETAARMSRTPVAFSKATTSAAIQCLDGPARQPVTAWPKVVGHLTKLSELWGPVLGWWQWAPCASNWPARTTDRYTGPWNARTKTPILLINNRYDPATGYRNAQRAERLLGNAVLLTSAGYGHPTYADPSQCIENWRVRYLVHLLTPPRGTVCPSDRQPFDPDFGKPLPGEPTPLQPPPGEPIP